MTDGHDPAILYALDVLDHDERATYEQHLATCHRCSDQVRVTRETAAGIATTLAIAPPPTLRTRVLHTIAATEQEPPATARHTALTRPGGTDGRGPAAPPAGHPNPPPPAGDGAPPRGRAAPVDRARHRPGRRHVRRWSGLSVVAVAAAIVLAVAAGGWGLAVQQRARQAEARTHRLAGLLAANDVTIRSAPTGGGHASVILSQNRDQAMFLATGLPALPAGKTYQLWTIAAAVAPAGIFTNHTQGVTQPVLVGLPASALSADTIAVTVEPAGGSVQPTSTPILTIPIVK